MGILDIILGGFLVYGLFKGFKNGFFVELASFFGLLIGIYSASKFADYTQNFLKGYVSWNPQTIKISAFLITFVLVVFGIYLLAQFLTTVVKMAFLGSFNRLAGAGLGILKLVLLLGIFLKIFDQINVNHFLVKKDTLENSIFYNPIQKTVAVIQPVFQDGLKTATNQLAK